MLFYVFLTEGKHLLMFNVQLCLIFERVSVSIAQSNSYHWVVHSLRLCRNRAYVIMDTTPIRH